MTDDELKMPCSARPMVYGYQYIRFTDECFIHQQAFFDAIHACKERTARAVWSELGVGETMELFQ